MSVVGDIVLWYFLSEYWGAMHNLYSDFSVQLFGVCLGKCGFS